MSKEMMVNALSTLLTTVNTNNGDLERLPFLSGN